MGIDDERDIGWKRFSNPVVIIAILILIAIFVLLGSAIAGYDSVLLAMARVDYARGLITYLFAVVTIGTAVVLVVSALTTPDNPDHKERFERGKGVLSLLLGIFGTMIGFYFGSEINSDQARKTSVQVAPLHLSEQMASAGSAISVDSFLYGGTPPYKAAIGFDGDPVNPSDKVDSGGRYAKSVVLPEVSVEKVVMVHLVAVDNAGNRGEASAAMIVKPK